VAGTDGARGRQPYLGTYDTPEEAARAWDAKALELRGPIEKWAPGLRSSGLNFPPGGVPAVASAVPHPSHKRRKAPPPKEGAAAWRELLEAMLAAMRAKLPADTQPPPPPQSLQKRMDMAAELAAIRAARDAIMKEALADAKKQRVALLQAAGLPVGDADSEGEEDGGGEGEEGEAAAASASSSWAKPARLRQPPNGGIVDEGSLETVKQMFANFDPDCHPEVTAALAAELERLGPLAESPTPVIATFQLLSLRKTGQLREGRGGGGAAGYKEVEVGDACVRVCWSTRTHTHSRSRPTHFPSSNAVLRPPDEQHLSGTRWLPTAPRGLPAAAGHRGGELRKRHPPCKFELPPHPPPSIYLALASM
jgi:hypothetical protein